MTESPAYRLYPPLPPERVIEVCIGLFDDSEIGRGKYPPALAAAILSALNDAGWRFFRDGCEADEHFDVGGECDHDGQDWPCAFAQRPNTASQPPKEEN